MPLQPPPQTWNRTRNRASIRVLEPCRAGVVANTIGRTNQSTDWSDRRSVFRGTVNGQRMTPDGSGVPKKGQNRELNLTKY